MSYETESEARAVAELTARPQLIDHNGIPVKLDPDGNFVVLDALMEKPVRQKGFITLSELDSFIRYTQANATSESELIVDGSGKVRARLDINAKGFRDFGAFYRPTCSKSWLDWIDRNGQKMDQLEFAEFIESHIDDLHVPEGSRLPNASDVLSFATSIEQTRNVSFKRSVCSQDGRVSLEYTEKSNEAQDARLEMFREFGLALRPLLDLDSTYAITATLRFRIRDGEVVFWYELKNIEAVVEKLRKDVTEALKAIGNLANGCHVPVYVGSI